MRVTILHPCGHKQRHTVPSGAVRAAEAMARLSRDCCAACLTDAEPEDGPRCGAHEARELADLAEGPVDAAL